MDRASILIIDDDASLRRTLTDILRVKGHDTLAAGNGTEGIALMKDNPVDLVLIDLGLPDLPGIDVLDRVKSERPSAEAIILTGNATLDSAIEATNRGAFSYLLKPYDIEQLLQHIGRALEKQREKERITRRSAEMEKVNAELKVLYDVSRSVSKTIDLDRLLSETLHTLAEIGIFRFELRGAIFLAEGKNIRLAAFIGLSETAVETCEKVGPGECLCGIVYCQGNILISTNSEDDHRHSKCIPGAPPHGHVIVPLKSADKVAGVLDLYTPPGTEFDESALKMLASIGGQIGIAIDNARLYEETKSSALHDPLTGLSNRRFLEIQLEKLAETAKRYGNRLSVIMLDIDHFKRYNDTRGHVEGDRLLAKIAAILSREMRSADYLFRYGGEEFLVILPESDLAMACAVAERLREAVEAEGEVTISLGVATYRTTMQDKESLVREADAALYRAKENGRNRVERTVDTVILPAGEGGIWTES